MGEQAVALAKAVGYDSAGTVEFVAGQDKSFFFLEMNTRLQVEHPVTELVTGIDLVEQMIRVAAGEPLPIRQQDVTFAGHAIEVRLCSENPEENFAPQSGRVWLWEPSPGVRVEHAPHAEQPERQVVDRRWVRRGLQHVNVGEMRNTPDHE